MRDYYYILGVGEKATTEEIKTAWRKLSKKFHPDKNDGDEFFAERFRMVQEAYEVLANAERRRLYDQELQRSRSSSSSQATEEDLRRMAEAMKRQFEEELKKREAAFKQQYQQRPKQQNPISPKPAPSKINYKESLVPAYAFLAGLVVLVLFIAYFINKQKATSETNNTYTGSTSSDPSLRDSADNQLADTLAATTDSTVAVSTSDNTASIQLTFNSGRTVSLSEYLKTKNADQGPEKKTYEFIDLDGDNIPELVSKYMTGGDHSSDINTLFIRQSKDLYQEVFTHVGGLSIESGVITLSFYKTLGNFHSDYSTEIAAMRHYLMPELKMTYRNKQFRLEPTDERLNSQLEENFAYLDGKLAPLLDADGKDDGTRKEFAVNIFNYHFNNGADLAKTKKKFGVYTNEDRDKIWNELAALFRQYSFVR